MESRMTTPLQIEIALHYWTRTTDYGLGNGDNNFDAPAVVSQRNEMLRAGLLNANDTTVYPQHTRNYAPGPALECYIKALCALPWPVQQWAILDSPRRMVTSGMSEGGVG
jgi:hypothetical protein